MLRGPEWTGICFVLHALHRGRECEPKFVGPVDTCFYCDGTPHIACHECKVLHCALHVSILCQSEICVGLHQFWTANLAVVAVASVVVAVVVVDTRPSVPTIVAASAINTRRGVWIYRKWYAVPAQYPQNADGQRRNDQAFCTELQGELKTALFGMCTNTPTVQGKPRHADTKADLIFKRVFCTYLQVVPTDVGHGPVRTLFLSVVLFLLPDPNCILLCWPSAN